MPARETKNDVAESDPVHCQASSRRIGSRGILAGSTSPSRLQPSRQVDGKGRFERRVQVRVLVHEVLEFRLGPRNVARRFDRSEEHTSELQSLMRISYAVFCLKKKKMQKTQ